MSVARRRLTSLVALICVATMSMSGGAVGSPVPVGGTLDLAGADETIGGGGPVVASAGDVNNDGTPDALVASPLVTAEGRARAGVVHVVFGTRPPPTNLDLGVEGGLIVEGPSAGARAGTSVAALGDVNGDGFGDLLVGVPRASFNGRGRSAGAAYVVFGTRDDRTVDLLNPGDRAAVIMGPSHGAHAGIAVASTGDLDGDGRREIVIGAPGTSMSGRARSGAAYVVFSTGLGSRPDLARPEAFGYRIDGASAGAATGAAVAGLGDTNGDGLSEVLVGAPGSSSAYTVFGTRSNSPIDLALLGARGRLLIGAGGELVGAAVADAGDVNGDGIPDAVVGAPGAGGNARPSSGAAYVVFGRPDPAPVALPADPTSGFRIDGAARGDRLGAAVHGAGDVNHDGRDDILVGAPRADPLERGAAGSAYVVLGGPLDLALPATNALRLVGAAVGAGAGRTVAGGTDVNGDGRPDLLIGADVGPASLVLTPPLPGPLPQASPRGTTCTGPATNIETIVGDSATMRLRDPGMLRRQALELLLSKPRPQSTVLGAVEFGSAAAQIFPPLVLAGEGFNDQLSVLRQLIGEHLHADAGRRDLAAGFAAAASENPGRQAQILIVDGANDTGPAPVAQDVPTYVVGLGVRADTVPGRQLDRLASASHGRFYADVRPEQLPAVLNAIDAALACETPVAVTGAGVPATPATAVPPPVVVPPEETPSFMTAPFTRPSDRRPRLRSISLVVSWSKRSARFQLRDVDVRRPNAPRVRIPGTVLQRAIRRGRAVRFHQLQITAREGRTFIAVRLTGVRARSGRTSARAASQLVGSIGYHLKPSHHKRRGLRSQVSGRWGPH